MSEQTIPVPMGRRECEAFWGGPKCVGKIGCGVGCGEDEAWPSHGIGQRACEPRGGVYGVGPIVRCAAVPVAPTCVTTRGRWEKRSQALPRRPGRWRQGRHPGPAWTVAVAAPASVRSGLMVCGAEAGTRGPSCARWDLGLGMVRLRRISSGTGRGAEVRCGLRRAQHFWRGNVKVAWYIVSTCRLVAGGATLVVDVPARIGGHRCRLPRVAALAGLVRLGRGLHDCGKPGKRTLDSREGRHDSREGHGAMQVGDERLYAACSAFQAAPRRVCWGERRRRWLWPWHTCQGHRRTQMHLVVVEVLVLAVVVVTALTALTGHLRKPNGTTCKCFVVRC